MSNVRAWERLAKNTKLKSLACFSKQSKQLYLCIFCENETPNLALINLCND